MNTLIVIILIYLTQMWACTAVHMLNKTRVPESVWDFLKLTFVPYILYKGLKNLKR